MKTKVIANYGCPYSDKEILTAFEHLKDIFGAGEHNLSTYTHHWIDGEGDCVDGIQFTPGAEITILVGDPTADHYADGLIDSEIQGPPDTVQSIRASAQVGAFDAGAVALVNTSGYGMHKDVATHEYDN